MSILSGSLFSTRKDEYLKSDLVSLKSGNEDLAKKQDGIFFSGKSKLQFYHRQRNELNETLSRKHYSLLVFLFIIRESFNRMLSRLLINSGSTQEIYGVERQLRGEDGGRGGKNSIILSPNEHSSPYPPLSILTITRGTRVTMREIAYFSPGGGEIHSSIARIPTRNSVEKSSVQTISPRSKSKIGNFSKFSNRNLQKQFRFIHLFNIIASGYWNTFQIGCVKISHHKLTLQLLDPITIVYFGNRISSLVTVSQTTTRENISINNRIGVMKKDIRRNNEELGRG